MQKERFGPSMILFVAAMFVMVSILPMMMADEQNGFTNGVNLIFEVPEPELAERYGRISVGIEGWGTNSQPGYDVVPERTFYIPLEDDNCPEIANIELLERMEMELELPSQKVPFPSVDGRIVSSSYSDSEIVDNLGLILVGDDHYMMIRLSPFNIDGKTLTYYSRIEVNLDMDGFDSLFPVTVPSDIQDPTVEDVDPTPLWSNAAAIPAPLPGGSYYNQDPPVECLIITSSALNSSMQPLANWKTQRGVPTKVVETSWIYSTFTGSDNQEKIRNCTKAFYNNEDLKWVVLGGDHSVVPTRLAYIPDGHDDSGSDGSYAPADGYYGDLAGTGHSPYDWDGDNDGYYGEYSVDGIDLSMEVYVGRLSATSSSAMTTLVNNILSYEKTPPNGSWFNRAVLAGAYSNYDTSTTGNNTTDEARLKNATQSDFLPWSTYNSYTLYERAGIWPSTYPSNASLTTTNLISAINSGAFMVNLAGHGSSTGIYRRIWNSDDGDDLCESGEYSDTPYYSTSASQTNGGKKPLFYNDACNNGEFDRTWCLTEDIVRDVGIGAVGAGRVSWYAVGWTKGTNGGQYNQGHDYRFWEQFFLGNYQPGKALALSHSDYISDYSGYNKEAWKNLVQYNLIGDPEINIWTQSPSTFSVTYSDPIPSPGNYQFTVTDGTSVVAGAEVTLMDGSTFWGNAVTDASGKATINLPQLTASMTLTVSKHNFKPFIRSVTVGNDNEAPTISGVSYTGATTTGDSFRIFTNITDNLEVRNTTIEYGWGTTAPTSGTNVSLVRNGIRYHFNGTHPTNSTDSFWYKLSANDTKGNWASTTWTEVTITDNDMPEFLLYNSSATCTTGDTFRFECEVEDNVAVRDCYVDYYMDGVGRTYTEMTGTGSVRSVSISIPSSQTGTLYYHFNLTDTSSNLEVSSFMSRQVMDNDAPMIMYATVDLPPTTGDFTWFYVNAVDNVGMFQARLVYYVEDQGSGNISMNYDGNNNYSAPVKFDNDKISNLTYQFFLQDGSGNRYISPPTFSRTVDNDNPGLITAYVPPSFYTGDKHDVMVQVSDNIKVQEVIAEVTFPSDSGPVTFNYTMEENLTSGLWEFRITAPNSPVGNVSIRFFITDTSANMEVTPGVNSSLVDNDAPLMVADRSDTTAVCGENVTYIIDASDNIEVASARLFISGVSGSYNMTRESRSDTFTIEVIAHESLDNITYHFEIEDIFGNIQETGSKGITVSDETLPSYALMGFSLPHESELKNFTTGDKFTFVSKVFDNIEVEDIWLEVKFPGNETVVVFTMEEGAVARIYAGYDHCYIDMPTDVIGEVFYRLIAIDNSGNNMTTEWYSLMLVDDDAPVLEMIDPASKTIYTDGIKILEFTASDNILITTYEVTINDHPGWDAVVLEIEGGYQITIQSDDDLHTSDALITFVVSDGNLSSEIAGITLKIKDKTAPIVKTWTYDGIEMSQSQTKNVSVNIADNSGRFTPAAMMIHDNGDSYVIPFVEVVGGIELSIKTPAPGEWTINISAHDDEMNMAWGLITLTVEDDIPPEVDISLPDLKIKPGEESTITAGDTSDDSSIQKYTWTVTGPDGTETYDGPEFVMNKSEPGSYNITLTVEDEFGNSADTTTTITVTPDTTDGVGKDDDNLLIYILIAGSVLLFIIVIIIVFVVVRKKKEPEYVVGGDKSEAEDEKEEEELEWG